MSVNFRLIAALVLTATGTIHAADVRITDHDQRFKAKYGVWPPHIRKSIEAEKQERARREDARRVAQKQTAEDADNSQENKDRTCNCERKGN